MRHDCQISGDGNRWAQLEDHPGQHIRVNNTHARRPRLLPGHIHPSWIHGLNLKAGLADPAGKGHAPRLSESVRCPAIGNKSLITGRASPASLKEKSLRRGCRRSDPLAGLMMSLQSSEAACQWYETLANKHRTRLDSPELCPTVTSRPSGARMASRSVGAS